MHIHILGICGTFMGGIAALAREAGHRVTGCDASVYPPMSTQLQALGIELIEGYGEEQLSLKPDVWVIGNVVSRGKPLMEAILNAGEPYVSGPEWLAQHVLQGRTVLAVAGTHGKTTTTSILTWILAYAGLKPGFLVGGIPLNFGVSARLGKPDAPFVIEADEYDTAFFDKRSKFVHYRPRVAILNNLEFDHADIFENLDAIERQFHHLVRTVPSQGALIVRSHEASLERVLKRGAWSRMVYFGQTGWQASGTPSDFEVQAPDEPPAHVRWELCGEHNQMNALAAMAAAAQIGVRADVSARALAAFKNVRRRLEKLGEVNGITLYDDFAHHPSAIATTLEGLRQKVGTQTRLIAVFEPRSNTMKLGTLCAQLPIAFKAADAVFAYTKGLNWDVAQTLAPLGGRAQTIDDLDRLQQSLLNFIQPGDTVVFMSNGGFGGIQTRVLNELTTCAKAS